MSTIAIKPLDAGFARLSGLISELGEGFRPTRQDIVPLMEDTRMALADTDESMRPRERA